MSMFDDVLGFGRTSVMESMSADDLEPEIADMTLEEAADIDEDPMDFMIRAAYENEMNMKNLETAIVAEEYMYLRENGQEMVTEDTRLQSIVDRFKSMVKTLWEKIQSFFKTVMRKIDEALKLDQRFLDKYEKKAAGKTGKAKGDESLFNMKEIADNGIGILDLLAEEANGIKNLLDHDQEVKYDDFIKFIRDGIGEMSKEKSLDGVITEKDLFKAMLKKTKENMKVGSFSADKAILAFKKSKIAKEELKKAYDKNKKHINLQIKSAKTMESRAKKFKIVPTEVSKSIHGGVKALNKLGSMMTMVNRTFVKLINMSRGFCKAVIVAAAAKEVEKPAAESASMIESFDLM